MKKGILIVFTVCFAFIAKAQQEPQLTHFMFDKLSINPAVAGMGDGYCLTAINRKQWAGAELGEPSTLLVNLNAPKIPLLRGGLGFSYIYDQLGYETNNLFRFSYSLHVNSFVQLPGELGIGFAATYFTKKINTQWRTPDGLLASSDPSIPVSRESESAMSFNSGIYYKQKEVSGELSGLYVGASVTNLTQAELSTLKLSGARHFYFMGGINYGLPAINTKIRFNALVKSDGVKNQADFNLNALFLNKVWAGMTYRHNDALAPMAGIMLNTGAGDFKVGYGYGISTSFIGSYFSSGNHEIMLNYCFNITIPPIYTRSVHPYLL